MTGSVSRENIWGTDMHHFFVEPAQIGQDSVAVTGSDVNHIRNVLRMKAGEQLFVYDGAYHEYLCRIREFETDRIWLDILEKTDQTGELASRLYLFQGLPKGDKMDLIIQKAVELGVYEIIPVSTNRSVVKLDEKKKAARQKRWQAISESAAKQSGRAIIPKVAPVMSFGESLAYAGAFDKNLIPYELEKGMKRTRQELSGLRSGMSVGIFIGPEGGFDQREIEEARTHGVVPVSLGRRILRTETAGLCMLSVIMFQLEEDGEDGDIL